MQFSYFVTLFEPEGPRPYHRMIAELREQVVACDQAGFRNIWLGEHHFGPEGMGGLRPERSPKARGLRGRGELYIITATC